MFAKGSIWYLYLSILGACLSGLFNFYCFENLFTTVPVVVSVLSSVLIAGLMYGLLWKIEDGGNYMVWILCAKISVITTIGAIFMSQVASSNSQETVEAHLAAREYMKAALAHDATSQEIWVEANRITTAANHRKTMDSRLVEFVKGAQKLEEARNGDALMSQALDKIPYGGGLAFLCLVSLLLALAFDLGPAKCVKIFREMNSSPTPFKRAPGKNKPPGAGRGSRDTGTTPGFDARYKAFEDALREGEVLPTIRSVKEVFGCSYQIAAAYLAAACQNGKLACKINAQGGKVYSHVK